MQVISGAGAFTAPEGDEPRHYVEHLRVPALSVGTYSVPVGGRDEQEPHTEDEIYVVTAGRARLATPDAEVEVGPGSVVYVPAGEEHRFVGFSGEFAVLVMFAPAEGSRR